MCLTFSSEKTARKSPARRPTLSRLTAEHNIAYTCKPWDTGAVVGTTKLISDGMEIVGLPVGNAKFVNAHVNTKADEHAERDSNT